ncbi:MAG TPA: GNAT family N-acetyltransferase [Mesorhizobium sp.]|jgi:ribosomal protein S18 acetylase RimI-like enzyme|uniref:GNAT family N-acetyltransferase n=1 Tax=Mesorhizobium sp. TaxID=1871066 RepID=UPI002DDD49B2|nr:GNAT family N-acetyltransferase [Mesorhizobium sp.]HEV2503529.1 GNAT family N-acetyltransferase [Mesorhizobium sp.]
MTAIEIRTLTNSPEILAALTEILVETVAAGGSVSFMHPLSHEAARAFWDQSLAAAARGDRVVLGAFDGDTLAGTVTLLLGLPQNQPHRAEIAKLMTRHGHRGRGIATSLMQAAEEYAVREGRTLLVLDTATDGGARSLYQRLDFTLAGEIPDYALKPHGGLSGTLLFWKRIGSSRQKPATLAEA